MRRFTQVLLLAGFMTVLSAATWANSAPVVSSVSASQRADDSKLVDIYYNLADVDGDVCTVWVAASNDGGTTWSIPVLTVSGRDMWGPVLRRGPASRSSGTRVRTCPVRQATSRRGYWLTMAMGRSRWSWLGQVRLPTRTITVTS